jgi:hypothetical protein
MISWCAIYKRSESFEKKEILILVNLNRCAKRAR